ncbi:hypothetical protein J4573_46260 [Actinomadura barringtoniae]|uniref:Secreted protein n=1 Tax=Actinomadura barringtoniae TaxID=1427535 RepID=A0A939PTN2_9ACTN|nr:hypothetical protein [Actinomadura barringtoniae]MBO2454561.1 hypothetical protein [Actinomadura barringtoniae]
MLTKPHLLVTTSLLLSAAVVTLAPAAYAGCEKDNPHANCGAESGGGSGGGDTTSPGGSGGGGDTGPGKAPNNDAGGIGAPPANPIIQHVPTIDLASSARDSLTVREPGVHTSPNGKTYVRVRTGLYINADRFRTYTAKAQAPPTGPPEQVVTATAKPQGVTWKMVESSLECDGPGAPNSTKCGYSYNRSSANQPGGKYHISATLTWSLTWTCQGTCDTPGGDLGPMQMTSFFDLPVGEIQTGDKSN